MEQSFKNLKLEDGDPGKSIWLRVRGFRTRRLRIPVHLTVRLTCTLRRRELFNFAIRNCSTLFPIFFDVVTFAG
ncbi:unnamed protein product [Dicrocoelium dendriticum]|nr:unnamed protein product [Dicrocoelium dendriticum]